MLSQTNTINELCEKCSEQYTGEWCKTCRINYFKKNFTNWTSENERIDEFIQEVQLSISCDDIVFEWIPYNQFNIIKEMDKDVLSTVHLAIWKDGPLSYDRNKKEWTRESDKKVALKCLYNSQNSIDEFLNEVKTYSTIVYSIDDTLQIYGISQNPDTKDYIMVLENDYCGNCGKKYTDASNEWCQSCQRNYLKDNFANWTSGNEIIDNFIQEMQLKISFVPGIVFEWIPYNQFYNIKEIGKSDFNVVYLATWKDGPLCYHDKMEWIRKSDKKITLKCLFNSQNIINEFLDEVKTYSTNIYEDNDNILKIYGISQDPNTKDYIMVLQDGYCKGCGEKYTDKWCKTCQINYFKKNFINWTSEDENIDNFIQEMQLKINNKSDTIFEWIPYNQFNNIQEISNCDLVTIHLATWKDGPLHYNNNEEKWNRESNKKVALKYLYNSQNTVSTFLNEVKTYFNNNDDVDNIDNDVDDTDDDIDIDDFDDVDNIDIDNDDDIDIDEYDDADYDNVDDDVVDTNTEPLKIYGISQDPNTKDYIIVLQDVYCEECGEQYANIEDKWCKSCLINDLKNNFTNWTSGNINIDKLIQEMQSKVDDTYDLVFEWIPYDQFNDIKKIGEGGFATIYSAIWKDGPLYFDAFKKMEWIRDTDKKVALKRLHNSQNITNKFLNEIKVYSIAISSKILKVYGISQNPDTKDYIMVLDYASGGNFNDWMNRNYKKLDWNKKLLILTDICEGLKEIHKKQMVHHDFHTGNILFEFQDEHNIFISDMGLCKGVDDINETKIFGVIPYVAPEVLKEKPYTQAADIYSIGMIMYFMATGRRPFANCAHDRDLVLNICNGTRPELNEPEAPQCYIDLMKRCWNSNPDNRPNIMEIQESILLFHESYSHGYEFLEQKHYEIDKQFKEAENYRKLYFTFEYNTNTHPQAIYISRLLNPYTKILPKYYNQVTEFSDSMAMEQLILQHMIAEDESDKPISEPKKSEPEYYNGEFSDGIAVEQLLLQHMDQLE